MRKIIHLDLDAFFCAVEELRNPALVGKPFAVGGRPEERGVVASCSYAARRFGVHSAMPMGRALRLCPELRIVPGRHGDYAQASRQVMERLHRLTAQVEQISIDEAFLDASELPGEAELLARALQATINQELHLPCSLGVAGNKLVAKIANDYGKGLARGEKPPHTVTLVPPGEEAAFLAPLPVERLWGVGPKTAARLAEIQVLTIGDLARQDEAGLVRLFGKNGHDLYRHARGIDDSPVVTFHEPRSASQEITFARDVRDEAHLRQTLHELAQGVEERLRSDGYAGVTVKLKLRWPDFTTLTRQTTLPAPTDQAEQIYQVALQLFERVWQPGKAVRLLGVGVSGFGQTARQLSLWEAPAVEVFPAPDAPDPSPTQTEAPAEVKADAPADPTAAGMPAPAAPPGAAVYPAPASPEEAGEKARRLEDAIQALQQRFGPKAVHKGK